MKKLEFTTTGVVGWSITNHATETPKMICNLQHLVSQDFLRSKLLICETVIFMCSFIQLTVEEIKVLICLMI